MADLLHRWLYEFSPSPKRTYYLLEQYQYNHDWFHYGDLGGLNVRTSGKYFEPDEDGEYMVIQPVWEDVPCAVNFVEDPILHDLIAWHPQEPSKWYFLRGEAGLILGEKSLFISGVMQDPLILHRTPFDWLKSGCNGAVLLDRHGLNRLYGLNEVVCENIAHGTAIEAGLSQYYKRNMPIISVLEAGGEA